MASGVCGKVVPDTGCSVATWREVRKQLAVQAWASESDARREVQLQSQRSVGKEQAAELRACWECSESERKVWEQDLWSGLGRLRKRVAALGANMRFVTSAEDLRNMVSTTERELQLYAEQARQQFDDLTLEESGLEESLKASLTRFEGWCAQESAGLRPRSCSRTAAAATSSSSAPKQRAHRPSRPGVAEAAADHGMAEIRERLDQLATAIDAGGMMGGWQADDHEAFMRLLTGRFKRRATQEFLVEAENLLPHLSHEALVAHVKWLTDHEIHQAERRQLLERWRALKEANRARPASEAPARSTAKEAHLERQQYAQKRQQELSEREEQRQRVEAWRKRKEEEQKEKEERQQRSQKAMQEKAAATRRQQEATQQELETFKRHREEAEAQLRAAAEATKAAANAQRRLSQEDKVRIAERNQALLLQREAKLRDLQERRSSAQAFEPPSRATGNAYCHVESRLQSHTEAFVEKSRELQENEAAEKAALDSKYGVVPGNFAHQGIIRTVRTSPSWRRGFGV